MENIATSKPYSEQLKISVNHHFEVDIDSPVRKKEYVNARMTYAFFMRKKGFSLERIGRFIGKDHATIVHYLKNIDWYMKTDPAFKNRFDAVYDDCFFDGISIYSLDKEELIKEVLSLRKENKVLSSQLDDVNFEQKFIEKESNRLQPIIDLVSHRTKVGQEDLVYRKINAMYNGL